MNKNKCKDCICLVEDENNEWFCDEMQLPIKLINVCPEDDDEFDKISDNDYDMYI